ncbi:CHAT domain-containing protein [Polyangium sp. 6x1]|uniref:tetratricopeptide repeat protein n=1 Tax=Polyangium sp. 6x1 TaxID=3042689 RepID=UPI0024822FA9|nr:CHAT domain-containing protein [Polyangium sp. 6x1]MDI1451540.1 tetratricopeptide repeat protein [Polyangium sp. 6x1]
MDPLYIVIAVVVALVAYFLLAGKRKARSDETPVSRHAKVPLPAAARRSGAKQGAPPKADPGTAINAAKRTAAPGGDSSSFEYSEKTVLFYDPSHGNQIEHYTSNGQCYLWYPGNRGVVPGEWRLEGEYLCFRYDTNTYNPVTGEHGGNWERTLLQRWGASIVDAVPGDVFGLATRRIPGRLPPHPEFRSIDEVKLGVPAAIGDDTPCPCGSDKHFWQCHGAEDPEEQEIEDSASELTEVDRLFEECTALCKAGEFDAGIPLARRALGLLEERVGPEHPDVSALLDFLATIYRYVGAYAEAEPLYERIVSMEEKAMGPDHPNVAIALNKLAVLCVSAGNHAKAEPLIQRALLIQQRALGPTHPDVAISLINLAAIHEQQGDFAEAEPLYQRALAIREQALGPEHPDVAVALHHLAKLHKTTGDYARAEALYQRGLAIQEQALRPGHPDIVDALNGLALLYKTTGDYARAEPLFQRAVHISEASLGPDSPSLADLLNNLAAMYQTKGDYARAESLFQRAHSNLEKALGPDHPRVATSLNNLAALYQAKGDYAKAEPLAHRALATLEKALGSGHPDVAVALSNLASIHQSTGDYAQAAPLYQRAISVMETALGPDHPDVAMCLHNLADLHRMAGDHDASEHLGRRALAIVQKAFGPDHPLVAAFLSNLGGVYQSRSDFAKAEELYQRALVIQEQALGSGHPDLASSLHNLATVYQAKRDYGKADPLYRRALSIREKALGPDHPVVATSLHHLAGLYQSSGDYARAEALYEHALSILEKALGPDHPELAVVLELLAVLSQAMNEPAKAIPFMRRAAAIQDKNAVLFLNSGSDEAKRAYMAPLRFSTYVAISLHVHFAPDVQAAKRLVLATILNRKGRVFDAMIGSFTALRHSVVPADLALLDQLRALNAQYAALQWRGARDMPVRDYRATLARIAEEREQLEAEITRRGVALEAELKPVTLEQVQAVIPAGAALVELFWYMPNDPIPLRWRKPRYVAYVLYHEGEIAWADLGEAERIDAAVRTLLAALRDTSGGPRPPARELLPASEADADPWQAARDLDSLVMQPVRRLLGSTRRILLSPDGELNLVPFGALIDEEGRYLVERYALTYLASGRDLLRLQISTPSRQGPVVVAAPDYDAAPAPTPARHRSARSEPATDARGLWFSPLRFAAEEGRAIARKLPGAHVLSGEAATKGALEVLAGPRVLHIATHGFFLPNQPALHAPPPSPLDAGTRALDGRPWPAHLIKNPLLRSGIALAGANRPHGDENGGLLTALEFSQLDLTGTKLVVLSACETGVGDVHRGDGVYGLRHAIMLAGAESQVMSLWSVDDAATRELMEAYYDKLWAGCGRGEALRQAQLEMLGRPDRAHPYYWASFIISGNDAPLDATAHRLGSAGA